MQKTNGSAATGASAISAIEARGLVRRFGAVEALANVSLTIRKGEFFSLLGPSGCGKTTLLRIIAGLEIPDSGELRIGGRDVQSMPAHKRPVNTVFQSYALFPHLTVRDNVAFGLRMKRVSPAQIAERVERTMTTVQIAELAERRPAQLSGGQKQRVALARAVVNEPEVLLLDEPLGALDLKLRKQLQTELHDLQRRLGITFIHVTHDQHEALVMSDRIAVMNAGRIEQLGSAREIYERPSTRFVAEFLGSCNLIDGKVIATTAECFESATALGHLRVRLPVSTGGGKPFAPGRPVTLVVRPEKIRLAPATEAISGNCVVARIASVIFNGAETQYDLRVGEQQLKAVALNTRIGHQGFDVGSKVFCHLPEEALIPLNE